MKQDSGKLSTGAGFLDAFLQGGYDRDIITTIYGPSGAGKTNFCLLAAVRIAETGKKVLFIDTEGGIAVDRIKQIAGENFVEVLKNVVFFTPTTFAQQKEVFLNLKELISEDVGLIVVDSISMLYRLELGRSDEVYGVNSALGKQIADLVEIARTRTIPVLITNQVYADFENKSRVKMVGGDILKYGSKCLLELQRREDGRCVVLRKHRSMPEGGEVQFKIISEGVQELH